MSDSELKYNNIQPVNTEDDDEIDLLQLGRELLRYWWIILLAALIAGGATFCCSRFLIPAQYESTAAMFILTKETTLTSLADLQIGSQLTNDYKEVIDSRPVMDGVISKLGLEMDYKTLKKKITVENPTQTRILKITAKDTDPVLAKDIADAVVNVSSEYIADIMEMEPPKMIESGEVATEKSSPHNGRNALIGAAAAALIVCAVIIIRFLSNDAIVTEEDVNKYLNTSVLVSIPKRETEELTVSDKKKKNRKKKKPAQDKRSVSRKRGA